MATPPPEFEPIESSDPQDYGDLFMCDPEDAQRVALAVIKDFSTKDRSSIDVSSLQEFLELLDVNTFVVNRAGLQLDVDGFRIAAKVDRNRGKHKLAIFQDITKDQEREVLECLSQISKWFVSPSHDQNLLDRCLRYWQMRVDGATPAERE